MGRGPKGDLIVHMHGMLNSGPGSMGLITAHLATVRLLATCNLVWGARCRAWHQLFAWMLGSARGRLGSVQSYMHGRIRG